MVVQVTIGCIYFLSVDIVYVNQTGYDRVIQSIVCVTNHFCTSVGPFMILQMIPSVACFMHFPIERGPVSVLRGADEVPPGAALQVSAEVG